MKILSLTGTPGTGKSTLGEVLKGRGYRVVDLNRLICDAGIAEGWDEERSSLIVDTDSLEKSLEELIEEGSIVEGHLSHHLNPTACVILRTSPEVLLKRLIDRGYSEAKARENAEAEALGIITAEALELGLDVYELDTTAVPPEEVADAVEKVYRYSVMEEEGLEEEVKALREGRIDYLQEVLKWY